MKTSDSLSPLEAAVSHSWCGRSHFLPSAGPASISTTFRPCRTSLDANTQPLEPAPMTRKSQVTYSTLLGFAMMPDGVFGVLVSEGVVAIGPQAVRCILIPNLQVFHLNW